MCLDNETQYCSLFIIFIFILYTIKNEFYNSTHLYEFIKFVIAIFLIICLYLFIVLIKKIYNNRIVPQENDIEENEENNIEITVPPDGVHS